ncbi:MAG: LD-carboxypeptidase [Paludibacteraceae bacterium]|nr:LD-carboxypeptidase [Paludibacteraceae bacterium]
MKHIRILSPSGAIDPDYIDSAANRLCQWGYQVSEGKFARGRFGRFSATDDERVQDLLEAFADPSVDYILCSRGGYGLQRIISRIPQLSVSGLCRRSTDGRTVSCRRRADGEPTAEATVKHLCIGFSDITELHQWALVQGRPSLHGLMCKHLAQLPEDSEMIVNWQRAVENQPLHYEVPAHPLNRDGEIQGILVGGNLSVLYGLQGTPYGLSALRLQQPLILFIEDIAERHYHIDRMMQNLKMSGILASVSGLVVGQFSDCEDDPSMNETIYQTILRAVQEYNYPVLFDFPAGHVERNMPLWLGKETVLKVSSRVGILQQ